MMLGGCIFGTNPGGEDNTTSSPDGGTTSDATTGGDTDGQTATCRSNEECDARQHQKFVCNGDNECVRADECVSGWHDVDGEEGNGCECPTDERGTFVRDSDGDGYPDPDGEEKVLCGGESGWVAEETPDDCRPEDARSHPDPELDDAWLCDGADNDCDQDSDEICCSSPGETEEYVARFSSPKRQLKPAITTAVDTSEGPSEAAYLVGWSEGRTLQLHLLDRRGDSEESISFEFEVEILDVALATSGSGYVVAVSTHGIANSGEGGLESTRARLSVSEMPANLGGLDFETISSDQGGTEVGTAFEANRYNKLALAATGDRRLVLYNQIEESVEAGGSTIREQSGRGYLYAEGAVGEGQPLAPPEDDRADKSFDSSVVSTGQRFVYAWRGEGRDVIWLSGIAAENIGGAEPQGPFQLGFDISQSNPRRVDVAHLGGDRFVVGSPVKVGENVELDGVQVELGEGGLSSQTGPFELVRSGSDSFSPKLAATDTDADGQLDTLSGVWVEDAGAGQALSLMSGGGQIGEEATTFSRMTEVLSSAEDDLAVARSSNAAGVIWQLERETDEKVRFAPLSLTGLPVCAE
jgi:hypothetical protein